MPYWITLLTVIFLSTGQAAFAQDLSQEILDKLVADQIARDVQLSEAFDKARAQLSEYQISSRAVTVMVGELTDDGRTFMFVITPGKNNGAAINKDKHFLRFTFLQGRSNNVKPAGFGNDSVQYEVSFDPKCIQERDCPMYAVQEAVKTYFYRYLRLSNYEFWKAVQSAQPALEYQTAREYIYQYDPSRCKPGTCLESFKVFIQSDGKLLGVELSDITYRPEW